MVTPAGWPAAGFGLDPTQTARIDALPGQSIL